ncbi:CocE/NonD family hydrolase [Corynebacterium guangdongense]|uniref:CocE/NonD family hydrolase n=1 Tax=Corynebacterium guangdongense TaxID=1783348 RepID=A0ABU2A0E4_9CORY|nr:CocE/NonD family hydrolase [Corynebacterium guangdongense]MDR7330626.1 putative CocE/NonD family hydrolase [Corynebacterium guangdongense]WJZ16642.1 Cocaine esterase [Corynebacterium guangdongense]
MKYIPLDEFPYQVDVVEDWIPLQDGTRLWMKAWLPKTEEKVPALLEYLPYRSSDWTMPRDHERHPYYAGHGYASIRVDIRGHGNSEGVPGDEYDAQEHADGLEVIDWIARQDWCDGNLGMFGISWGGFNSLQLAALKPEPLKAIVTVCSTDDRYDNDVHYMGGSMLAIDMHAWAATMLAFESRPVDKRVWGDEWRQQWEHRLNRLHPYLDEWMTHQTRDDFWKHGSVCEDYDAIDAAVLAVGGWYDPYRDTVLRLSEELSARGKNVRGVIGPWSHQYPDRSLKPGPFIDFLGETLRWWDYWLKGKETGVMDEPLLRTWITDSVRPSSHYEEMPGRWVAEDRWPSPAVTGRRFPLADAQVTPLAREGRVVVDSPQDTGRDAGRYFPYGNDADLPVDQRSDDGRSTTFDFALTEDVEILGNASVTLNLSTDSTRGQVYVRLCDVAPDGSSTLITRGNLNLSSREGRDRIVDFPAGEWETVEIPMTGIGYRVPAGHTLRLAVSTAYWPWIWPQAGTSAVSIDLAASLLTVPGRDDSGAELDRTVAFAEPVQPEPLDVKYPAEAANGVRRPERLVTTDVVKQETMLQVDPGYGGTRIYPDGLIYDEESVERYWITADDPTSARTEAEWNIRLRRPDLDWDTSVSAVTRITCDEGYFYTTSTVICRDGEEEFFTKTWENTIPRTAS